MGKCNPSRRLTLTENADNNSPSPCTFRDGRVDYWAHASAVHRCYARYAGVKTTIWCGVRLWRWEAEQREGPETLNRVQRRTLLSFVRDVLIEGGRWASSLVLNVDVGSLVDYCRNALSQTNPDVAR